jgi:hypothetical protein
MARLFDLWESFLQTLCGLTCSVVCLPTYITVGLRFIFITLFRQSPHKLGLLRNARKESRDSSDRLSLYQVGGIIGLYRVGQNNLPKF